MGCDAAPSGPSCAGSRAHVAAARDRGHASNPVCCAAPAVAWRRPRQRGNVEFPVLQPVPSA